MGTTPRWVRILCALLGILSIASTAVAVVAISRVDRLQSQCNSGTRVEIVEQEGDLAVAENVSGVLRLEGGRSGDVVFPTPFDAAPVITIYEKVPEELKKRAIKEEQGHVFSEFMHRRHYRDRLSQYEKLAPTVHKFFEVRHSGAGQGFSWMYSPPEDQLTYPNAMKLDNHIPDYWDFSSIDGKPRVVRWKARGIRVVPVVGG